MFTPTAKQCSWCVLFILWLCVPPALAESVGLINPAEREFGESKPETRNPAKNFARKSPAFIDRPVPASEKPIPEKPTRTKPTPKNSEPIRQVSAINESDPFPPASPPLTSPPVPPSFPFNSEAAAPADPNSPFLPQYNTQNSIVPYDPQIFTGYVNPQAAIQGMQNSDPAGLGYALPFAQQQFAQQQIAPYPQQYAMTGITPYMNVNPYMPADPYAPFSASFADPYGMYQMNYQPDNQETPDYSSLYQTLLLQASLQAEEAQDGANKVKRQSAEDAKKQADANWTYNNLMPVKVSSPLGETLFACARTVSPFSTPAGPDKGVGMPLVGKSWLDHPYYFGGFVGRTSGSNLVSKMINQKSGGIGGLTFGYNFNDYWGIESRLNFAAIDIYDTDYARGIFDEVTQGETVLLPATRTNNLTFLDAAVHYYPLGNAKWRPYFKYGLGFGRQKFVNTFGNELSADIVTMPLGIGVRYWWNERIAIQMDLVDNVIFASGISKTQGNVAFTLGLTYAFGNGHRTHPVYYWPATPSMGSKW